MIDTHVHLDDSRFEGERDNVVERYLSEGVQFVINNSCDTTTLDSSIALANKYPSVYATIGIHPHDATSVDDKVLEKMRQLATHPKVVAVGEIGLDYYYDNSPRDIQREAFERQLKLSADVELPVTLHIRDAYGDATDILNAHSDILKNGVLWHCYSGSAELARQFASKGHYFAFGGAITFKNAHKEDVIKAVPLNQVLCETDCPYMTPVPYRGTTNYPHYVKLVIEKLAQVYQLSFEDMDRQLMENAKRFFKKIK